jgi:hypothetical protein
MKDAHTQHRQKTAAELGDLAETVVDEKWDEDGDGSLMELLKIVEDKDNKDFEAKMSKLLKKKAKGIGIRALISS